MSQSDAHVQDSYIIALTKFEQNEKGHMRMTAQLPSGRQVASEWFDPGKRREVGLKWIPGVREQIILDEEETKLRARRDAALSTRQSQSDAPDAEERPHSETAPMSPSLNAEPSSGAAGRRTQDTAVRETDPLKFAQQQAHAARTDLEFWNARAQEAAERVAAAEQRLHQWETIFNNLTLPKRQLELF